MTDEVNSQHRSQTVNPPLFVTYVKWSPRHTGVLPSEEMGLGVQVAGGAHRPCPSGSRGSTFGRLETPEPSCLARETPGCASSSFAQPCRPREPIARISARGPVSRHPRFFSRPARTGEHFHLGFGRCEAIRSRVARTKAARRCHGSVLPVPHVMSTSGARTRCAAFCTDCATDATSA